MTSFTNQTTTHAVSLIRDYAAEAATSKLHEHSGNRSKWETTKNAEDISTMLLVELIRRSYDCSFPISERDNKFATLCIRVSDKDLRFPVPCATTIHEIFHIVEFLTGLSQSVFRLKHKDRLIFFSDGKKRSLTNFGICGNDEIIVSRTSPSLHQETPTSFGGGKVKGKTVRQRPHQRRTPWSRSFVEKAKRSEDYLDVEAELQARRMKLDDGSIKRTKPNIESKAIKPTPLGLNESTNPSSVGNGCKAGNGSTIVNIGEVENLYKTSKRSKFCHPKPVDTIDLHRLTRDEAWKKLEKSLPIWIDKAMEGPHPYVIPVEIIHGKGKQVLAEMVEQWIKSHSQVAKAPKL